MVYDERSNFVGDSHWQEGQELEDGEEFELERNGVLVQVGECTGRTDQDLTELLGKRLKEREERAANKNNATGVSRPASTTSSSRNFAIPASTPTERPKPLSALLGTPSGHYGRALLPSTSPFEQKRMLDSGQRDGNEDDRQSKRRKVNEALVTKSGYAQNLTGATLVLSGSTVSSQPSFQLSSTRPRFPSSKIESVDLTSDEPGPTIGIPPRKKIGNLDAPILASSPQRTTSQLNKPSKTHYANGLTGASLVLSQPSTALYSIALQNGKLSRGPVQDHHAPDTLNGLEEEDRDNFVDIDDLDIPATPLIPPVRNQHNQSEKGPTPSIPRRSLTPVLPKGTNDPAKLTSSIVNHASEVDTEAPRSSLRIRPRPPRKMMMLMQRPQSSAIDKRKVQNQEMANKSTETASPEGRHLEFEAEAFVKEFSPVDDRKPNSESDSTSESSEVELHVSMRKKESLGKPGGHSSERPRSLAEPIVALDAPSPAVLGSPATATALNDDMAEANNGGPTSDLIETEDLISESDLEESINVSKDAVADPLSSISINMGRIVKPSPAKASHHSASLAGQVSSDQTKTSPLAEKINTARRNIMATTPQSSTVSYVITNNPSPAAANFRAKMLPTLREGRSTQGGHTVSPNIKKEQGTIRGSQTQEPLIGSGEDEKSGQEQLAQQARASMGQDLLTGQGSGRDLKGVIESSTSATEIQIKKSLSSPASCTEGGGSVYRGAKARQSDGKHAGATGSPRQGMHRTQTIPAPTSPSTATRRTNTETPTTGPWSRESFDLFGGWRPPRTTGGQRSMTT